MNVKYLAKCVGSKTKVFKAKVDISRGCTPQRLRHGNAAVELVNFCSEEYPWLRTRDGFFCKAYNKVSVDGMGVYNNNLYYVHEGYFYYNDVKCFSVKGGKKKFFHCNGKILIFPDMLYFEPDANKYGSFGVSTGEIIYTLMNRTVGTVNWGLSCVKSDDAELTELFKAGDRIRLTDEHGFISSDFHKIIGIDKELDTLFFGMNEFGSSVNDNVVLRGRLSHGAPVCCDAACVSGGRVWVAGNNKIQASAVNDECNWAIEEKNEASSFTCDIPCKDKITACIGLKGEPVFFSENKIYKIYGSKASNFYLRECSEWGGVPSRMKDTVAVVGDRIFYVSSHGVMCFDGVSTSVIQNTPFDCKNVRSIGSSDGDKYYLCIGEGISGRLYAYDTSNSQWYDYGHYSFIGFFTYNNALCAYDGIKITVLSGDLDMMEEHQYKREAAKQARASFEIETSGAKPYKICIECDTGADADYNVCVREKYSHTGIQVQSAEILIGNILSDFSGMAEFMSASGKCDSIIVSVRGTGEMLIKDIYAECTV